MMPALPCLLGFAFVLPVEGAGPQAPAVTDWLISGGRAPGTDCLIRTGFRDAVCRSWVLDLFFVLSSHAE